MLANKQMIKQCFCYFYDQRKKVEITCTSLVENCEH